MRARYSKKLTPNLDSITQSIKDYDASRHQCFR